MLAVSEAIAHNADLRVGAARVEQALLHGADGRRQAVPVGRCAGARRRQDVRRRLGFAGRRVHGELGARPLGEGPERPRRRRRRCPVGPDRLRVRQAVGGGRWLRGAGSWRPRPSLQADLARAAVADVEGMVRLAEARAQSRRRQRGRCLRRARLRRHHRDVLRADRTRAGTGHSGAGTGAWPLSGRSRRRRAQLPGAARRRFRPACRPSCSSAGRTSWPRNGEWRPHSTAFSEAKAARLPAITLTTGVSSISSELFVLQDHDNPVWNLGANLSRPSTRAARSRPRSRFERRSRNRPSRPTRPSASARSARWRTRCRGEIAAREREQILAQTVADSRRALEIVQTQFKVGSTDLRVRDAAPARAQRDPVGAGPRAGRTARAARQPAPGARRQLRAAPRAADDNAVVHFGSVRGPGAMPRLGVVGHVHRLRGKRDLGAGGARRRRSLRRAAVPESRGSGSSRARRRTRRRRCRARTRPRRRNRTRTDSSSIDGWSTSNRRMPSSTARNCSDVVS